MKAIATVINADEATETKVALVEPMCCIPVLARTAAVPNPRAAPRDKAIPSIKKLPQSLVLWRGLFKFRSHKDMVSGDILSYINGMSPPIVPVN